MPDVRRRSEQPLIGRRFTCAFRVIGLHFDTQTAVLDVDGRGLFELGLDELYTLIDRGFVLEEGIDGTCRITH